MRDHEQTRPVRAAAVLGALALALLTLCGPARAARITQLSPQGEVAQVRQIVARFDAPVVPFGDPRLPDPLRLRCEGVPAAAIAGQGRWTGAQEWVFDLRTALPPGVQCQLDADAAWLPLGGAALEGDKTFRFATGGPAVVSSWPYAGAQIEEGQYFLLRLNGPAAPASVTANAWCEVQGLGERLGVKVIDGAERDAVLKAQQVRREQQPNALLLACQRPFPPATGVRLVWGAGIAAANNPKVLTRQPQTLQWRVRERFTAEFSCERERADAPCLPLRPLVVRFSAPVPRALADKTRLQPEKGAALAPFFDKDDRAASVSEVVFAAPLPEHTRYTLSLPPDLRDLSGRALANASSFPLATATGALPPLAKFAAAPFGILEWPVDEKTGRSTEPAALPLTMRFVQADIAGTQPQGQVRIKRLDAAVSDLDLLRWIQRLQQHHESQLTAKDAGLPAKDWFVMEPVTDDNGRTRLVKQARMVATRELSLLARETGTTLATLPPPPKEANSTEVIGVPLAQPGYHVLEIESRLLGDKLLAKPQPMYVRTGALVTNLGVHFKRGRESSLVWVTTLGRGQPVAGVDVAINDCRGQRLWSGRTDAQGLARVPRGFDDANGPGCLSEQGYFVTARKAGAGGVTDLSFVFSGWQQGIETWRFNHPTASGTEPELRAHTVFDRTLLRAGETVSMKHLLRRQTAQGLAALPVAEWPTEMKLTHVGSGEQVVQVLPAPVQGRSIATSWAIPASAKLGAWEVSLHRGPRTWWSGSFRVEAFKVPLVDARLSAPKGPLVAPQQLALQAQLNYLAGGAVGSTKASLSALLRDRQPSFAGYEDYSFQPPRERKGRAPDVDDDESDRPERITIVADKLPVATDAKGAATVKLDKLPTPATPSELVAELTFADPNGEFQTVSQTLPLWPSAVVLGLRAKSWLAQRGSVQFQALVLDTNGKPQAGREVSISGRAVRLLSTRKRIVGGFYAYDEQQEVSDLGKLCSGKSDARGLVLCEATLTQAGEVELIAQASDDAGRTSRAATSVWISRAGDTWFAQDNDDRIDVLPEKRELAPGDTARLQVRMPYRAATALVTVEREGVIEAKLVTLRGDDPVIEVPIPKVSQDANATSWAPNVYVGVLVLRGRLREVPWYSLFQWGWRAPVDWWHAYRDEGRDWKPPTAMVDLAKPSYKFGVAALRIGLAAHRLDVKVTPAQPQYGVRQTAQVTVQVTHNGKPAANADVAFAAVDEGLLALKDNTSWQLLDAMFQPRAWGVETSTAQNEIIGRRHYGRKAIAAGGGGGRNPTRELFDTLLLWLPSVKLDANGQASVNVPLNDSLTSFRLVAVADAGADRFGSGSASIRVTQDLQVLAGLPPLVRGGDRFEALLTLRNTTTRAMTVNASLTGSVTGEMASTLAPVAQRVSLPAGAAQEVRWPIDVPVGASQITWQASVQEASGGAQDRLLLTQAVQPAVPLRVLQATLQQLDGPFSLPVAPPADGLPGPDAKAGTKQGGLQLTLRPKLAGALPGIRRYFETYPYSCLEQQASRAVGLRDAAAWQQLSKELPGYLDRDGLASYFPTQPGDGAEGSDRLSAYLLSLAHQAGWQLPGEARDRMLDGLAAFVEGRLMRRFPAPRNDLDVRKLAALEALSRYGRAQPRMLGSLSLTPGVWPTSALLDWLAILQRVEGIPERAARLDEAQRLLRTRLIVGGTTLRFVDEAGDAWWWLMDGADSNAARLLLLALDDSTWQAELPRLASGLVTRLNTPAGPAGGGAGGAGGAFATTTANAWATLAFERFSALREATPVTGKARAQLGSATRELDWAQAKDGGTLSLPWPAQPGPLNVTQQGSGKPWLAVQSLAAVPLTAPLAAGYRIERSVTPVEQKQPGRLSRGDVLRVTLNIEAQAELGWVVISDPVPAGATLLGNGLGRDSQVATAASGGERRSGSAWLAYEERRPDAWRAYYAWLPRGKHTVSYTLRLNTPGRFQLPPTRVEAMYAPENFGEAPNAMVEVGP
ncbi:MAG: MG2 domain-containing protein [Burkholderiales bacterium]